MVYGEQEKKLMQTVCSRFDEKIPREVNSLLLFCRRILSFAHSIQSKFFIGQSTTFDFVWKIAGDEQKCTKISHYGINTFPKSHPHIQGKSH